jgi:uncharacterized protein YdbL (DUF1318 family)
MLRRNSVLLSAVPIVPLTRYLAREIAIANGRPEWENDIRATFAQRWIERARPGWYYQNANGNWVQK